MMLILSRDIQQISHRAIRDEYGDLQPAFSNRNRLYLMELTRSGWRNPMGAARSDLQRVSYELLDGELLRHYWTMLDRPQDSESVIQTLLTDIDTFSIRFMNDENQWTDSWPPEQTDTDDTRVSNHLLPKAVEVTLEHNYFGTLKRLYDLPQFIDIKTAQAAPDENETEGDESQQQENGSVDNDNQ
jgi:general secretion pathway protein J